METKIPQQATVATYEGHLAERVAELLPDLTGDERLELLGAMDPDDMSTSLAWIAGMYPQVFDFALVRDRALVARLTTRLDEDQADEDEPYCHTCGAAVGIFIGHGDAWLHYTGEGTVASPVELFDAGHAPEVAWRPAGARMTGPQHECGCRILTADRCAGCPHTGCEHEMAAAPRRPGARHARVRRSGSPARRACPTTGAGDLRDGEDQAAEDTQRLAGIRVVLAKFDWEHDDRQSRSSPSSASSTAARRERGYGAFAALPAGHRPRTQDSRTRQAARFARGHSSGRRPRRTSPRRRTRPPRHLPRGTTGDHGMSAGPPAAALAAVPDRRARRGGRLVRVGRPRHAVRVRRRSTRCPASGTACRLNTAITLPVGVEAYGAYALGAWLTPGHAGAGPLVRPPVRGRRPGARHARPGRLPPAGRRGRDPGAVAGGRARVVPAGGHARVRRRAHAPAARGRTRRGVPDAVPASVPVPVPAPAPVPDPYPSLYPLPGTG